MVWQPAGTTIDNELALNRPQRLLIPLPQVASDTLRWSELTLFKTAIRAPGSGQSRFCHCYPPREDNSTVIFRVCFTGFAFLCDSFP